MRGLGWLLPGKSMAQELDEHQGLVDVADAHAPRDGVAQALQSGGGGWGQGHSGAGALLPELGVAAAMQNGQNNDGVLFGNG